MKKRIIA